MWSLELCPFATGNIGYGKDASQTGMVGQRPAELALDGRGYGLLSPGGHGITYCAHPDAGRSSVAHWTVDLGKRHQILNVTIYNRQSSKCKV